MTESDAVQASPPPTRPGPLRLFDERRRRRVLGVLLLLVVGLPAIVPIFYVVVNSFTDSSLGQAWEFSLEPWARMFESTKTLRSIFHSILLTVRVPLGIVVAFAFAWALVRVDIPGRRVLMFALWFTFFIPILPMTLGWVLLAHRDFGLLNELLMNLPLVDHALLNIESLGGILWVHLTLATIPIMTLLLAPAMQSLDGSFEEASDMAGARLWTTLRRITFPLILPAILTAFIAGLIKALEVFEVEQILGAPAGIFVYATRIFNLLRVIPPDYPQAMALSTMFLFILVLVAFGYQYLLRRSAGRATLTGRGTRLQPRARTWRAWVVSISLYGALVVSVGLPFLMLVLGSFNKLFGFFFIDEPWTLRNWTEVLTDDAFLVSARNSLIIGLSVAAIGTLGYAVLGTVLARSKLWGKEVVSLLTWLPWAIPGVLMSTAFLNIFLNTPLLTGFLTTLVPLAVVLLVQQLPLGTHMLRSAVGQISPELEEASLMSGASRWTTFRRITLPLVSPTFISVFVLVFMTAVRDISATVLLASPGTRTVPLLMFEFAAGARQESAVVIGVIMAVFALVMTVTAFRIGAKFSIEV